MKDIVFLWDMTDDETDEFFGEPKISDHGKCIGYRQELFHDVHIYEDGYEERMYIGN